MKPCEACDGTGRQVLGEHFVTRDMASDAGEPAMEGMSMGLEYAACQQCSGEGVVFEPCPLHPGALVDAMGCRTCDPMWP